MNIAELELDAVADAIEEAGYTVGALRIRQVLREFEKLTLELATTAADHEADKRSLNWCGEQLAACAEYLKEGETVVECIARNRRDADEMLCALANERKKVEARDVQTAELQEKHDALLELVLEIVRIFTKYDPKGTFAEALAATRKESEHG